MDLETTGASAASGFLASLITLLGWNRRLNKVEDEKATKGDIAIVQRQVDDLRDEVKEDRKYIRNRLDDIMDRLPQKGGTHE